MSKVLSEYKYSNAEVVNTLKLLSPRKTDKTPIRIGNEIDGGYILLKELIKENIIPDYINELYGEWHGNKITPIDYWIDFSHKLEKELDSLGFIMEEWCAPKNIVNRDYYLKK